MTNSSQWPAVKRTIQTWTSLMYNSTNCVQNSEDNDISVCLSIKWQTKWDSLFSWWFVTVQHINTIWHAQSKGRKERGHIVTIHLQLQTTNINVDIFEWAPKKRIAKKIFSNNYLTETNIGHFKLVLVYWSSQATVKEFHTSTQSTL